MILNILSDSIKYVVSNPKNILKLGFFELFSFLLFPFIIVAGYQYKIIDDSLNCMINEDSKLVDLSDYKNIFLNGFKLFCVKMIYLMVPILSFLLLYMHLVPKIYGSIIFVILFAVFYCYAYIAISNMVNYNSFKKAFDFREINQIIFVKISLTVLFGVFLAFALIYYMGLYIVNEGLYDFINFINIDFTIFSITLSALLSFIASAIVIQPFMHILVARISGLLYMEANDDY